MTVSTFRYVIYSEIDAYLARGWLFEAYLGDYSALMKSCECNPEGREP